jgi:hypothetical protein
MAEKKFEKDNQDILAGLEGSDEPKQAKKTSTTAGESISLTETDTTEDKTVYMDVTVEEKEEKPQTKQPELKEEGFEIEELSDQEVLEVKMENPKEDKEKTFIIETTEILQPILKDEEGNFIPPKPFNEAKQDSKVGYKTKVKITYKDSNYVSYIPNIKWFPGIDQNSGKKVLRPWFGIKGLDETKIKSKFTPEITKLYHKFCMAKGIEPGKLSQNDFIRKLVGEKVKLDQYAEEYNGKMAYRIDIAEFVE